MKIEDLHTAVQTLPGAGPYIHFSSCWSVMRSGEGKHMGRTQRLNRNGVLSRNNDKSLAISEK